MTPAEVAKLDTACKVYRANPNRTAADFRMATSDPIFAPIRSGFTEALSTLDRDALYQYGKFFICVRVLYGAAIPYFLAAAEKGDVRAMKALSDKRLRPTGWFDWLKKAAEVGDAEAQLLYATELEDRGIADSGSWYKAAAARPGPYQAQARAALARIQAVEEKRLAAERERRDAEQLEQEKRETEAREANDRKVAALSPDAKKFVCLSVDDFFPKYGRTL
jgi:hypothetical protein